MAGRTTRPDNWATAELNPDFAFFNRLIAVATPCDGGIEYVGSVAPSNVLIHSGTYPDQYGEASFALDPTTYIIDTTTPFTVLVVAKDEDSTAFNWDIMVQHGVSFSSVNNSGYFLARRFPANIHPKVFNNNWLDFTVPAAAAIGTVRNILMTWQADAALGSRFITIDINSTADSTVSPMSFDEMRIPVPTDALQVGSAKQSVQLVAIFEGTFGAGSRGSFLTNIWQLFLEPTDISLVIPGVAFDYAIPQIDIVQTHELVIPPVSFDYNIPQITLQAEHNLEIPPVSFDYSIPEITIDQKQVLQIAPIVFTYSIPEIVLGDPSLGCVAHVGSSSSQDAGLATLSAPDFTITNERKYDRTWHDITVRWPSVDLNQVSVIEAFFETNLYKEFEFTAQSTGIVYICQVVKQPTEILRDGGSWDVTVEITGYQKGT